MSNPALRPMEIETGSCYRLQGRGFVPIQP